MSRRMRSGGGFAVIVTLVLMAFAVGLIGALATLTRIEGNISHHARRQAQARQNALMALRIAMGQLQHHAGPDTRVTATAEAFGGAVGTNHYTGVWTADATDANPLTWLVSGNENGTIAHTPNGLFPTIELVGVNTSGVASDVLAPLELLTTDGVVTGHYAWWVGDEGVKASVGVADDTSAITYAPYDSLEVRRRLRQQRALGAGPVDASGTQIFEPRDAANTPRVNHLTQFNQLGFLGNPDGTSALGQTTLRPYFHAWTTDHRAVLANSSLGGLRRDLSLKPDLLGDAFVAWANYAAYMEDPSTPLAPAISPSYPAALPNDSLRRRFRMTPALTASGVTHGVTPVLSYFLLTFNIRTDQSVSSATRPLEVRARWLASFWNPYSNALVPETLQLEITGLPAVTIANDTTGVVSAPLALDDLYGAPLRIALPWIPGGRDDQQSWLPGRVYTWSAKEDLNKPSAVPPAGFDSVFYTRTMSTTAGQGVQRAVAEILMANSAQAHIQGNQTTLIARLYRVPLTGSRELLGAFVSPAFNAFSTTPAAINASTYQITYVFHLAESIDTPATPDAWLTSAGQDFREAELPGTSFVSGPNGPRPELYPNYTTVSFPDRLLDRALPASAGSTTGQSYNEDTPLFELPRAPLVSVGALQQLHTAGTRPLAIGNSWGNIGGWNAFFDRYFFSGLTPSVVASPIPDGAPFPNSFLRFAARKSDGASVKISDMVAEAATGFSSRYLLQSGAFNINSVSVLAWAAVLRSSRLNTGEEFSYLDASVGSGTSADVSASAPGFADAVFYRFPFSAHETYKAASGFAASITEPPATPSSPSMASTHLFRRGARALSADQTLALANTIAGLIRFKHADSGPFRSIEEFLARSSLFGGMNLLESAVATAVGSDGRLLNDPAIVPEFSSQWLTSGDIVSTLAPVLFARSDTFLIRAYGDSSNAVTGDREARAWVEARVQRTPDYVDGSQPSPTAPAALNLCNQSYGRRFKIVSFRWLTSTDI